MKNIVPFITSIYYPIWLWPKNPVLGGFPENIQLADYLVRIAFKSKKNVLFLSIFAILSSPTLYLFFRPFWEILSRKLDDDDVMLSWKLVRKSEIRFPMPFLRLYIDQIFSACLIPLSASKMTLLFSFIHFRTSSIKKEKWNATERIIWRILQFFLWNVHRNVTKMKDEENSTSNMMEKFFSLKAADNSRRTFFELRVQYNNSNRLFAWGLGDLWIIWKTHRKEFGQICIPWNGESIG